VKRFRAHEPPVRPLAHQPANAIASVFGTNAKGVCAVPAFSSHSEAPRDCCLRLYHNASALAAFAAQATALRAGYCVIISVASPSRLPHGIVTGHQYANRRSRNDGRLTTSNAGDSALQLSSRCGHRSRAAICMMAILQKPQCYESFGRGGPIGRIYFACS